MSPSASAPVIRLRGVRHNNLKGFDLDLPHHRLIVVTGLSGSGKSSLAFDTLFAEGQRRYIETFSPYARQFFDRMDKPRVDSIEGIPPAIAIEQRNAVRSTRSTVGTMTEVCDYVKVLWPHLAQLHCRGCGKPVRKDSPQQVWRTVVGKGSATKSVVGSQWSVVRGQKPVMRSEAPECLVTFEVPLSDKLPVAESLALVAKQGYQRLLLDGRVVRLEEVREPKSEIQDSLTIVQDRLRLAPANRARFIEACEQAYHFGKGRLAIRSVAAGLGEGIAGGLKGSRLEEGAASPPPPFAPSPLFFSAGLHCADCDLEYREPTPALFSFNHPLGACSACKGFGRIISIDYDLALPDRALTLAEGAVKPWRSGFSAECQADLAKFCRTRHVPMNVPFRELSAEHQRWVTEGDADYGVDEDHQWPQAWYGIKGYFRWLESKAYKMHVRVLLSRYRAYAACPECGGRRLKPDALLWRLKPEEGAGAGEDGGSRIEDGGTRKGVALCHPGPSPTLYPPSAFVLPPTGIDLAGFYAMPIAAALRVVEHIAGRHRPAGGRPSPIDHALGEVRARLGYLVEVGLGYLTLDRATRTLSGGETERVNLTTCLGSRLVNTLFVLDEPSVGLHPRDTERLIRILERLRDTGNTVVVVEHEASVMRAADQIVDLGPGHGETGGSVVFQGTYGELRRCPDSLTGDYLGGRRRVELPVRRPVQSPPTPALRLAGVTRHNLRDLAVELPLGRFVVVTGVSGSGKSTLIREVLFPELQARLSAGTDMDAPPAVDGTGDSAEQGEETASAGGSAAAREFGGWERLDRVVMVDQSSLGKTPRSNPAVYLGAFEDIRDLFAASEVARQRGLNASAFSFNSGQGQCERCRGAGFEKIEMQFLSDVFIRCPDCNGRRYREHILEVRIQKSEVRSQESGGEGPGVAHPVASPNPRPESRDPKAEPGWSIADVLDATAEDAHAWLGGFPDSRPARRAAAKLELLIEVGLGYVRLGQPINTLSGGESQRLKLAAHLAENLEEPQSSKLKAQSSRPAVQRPKAKGRSSELGAQRGAGGAAQAVAGPGHPVSGVRSPSSTLFLFDEPTTGLHFEDVRVLLQVFQRLVDAGHSVIVIEHNLDVVKCADWVIDLGPEAGEEGGRLVVAGTPETVADCAASHTGRALRTLGMEPPTGERCR